MRLRRWSERANARLRQRTAPGDRQEWLNLQAFRYAACRPTHHFGGRLSEDSKVNICSQISRARLVENINFLVLSCNGVEKA